MRPLPIWSAPARWTVLCGDVGFGKTEVAIRAIFKAVLAGKQVALLAPTTGSVSNTMKTLPPAPSLPNHRGTNESLPQP